MFLIPAIDLKDGCCVRLSQGEMSSATTYYDDPADAAAFLRDAGADLIHVVDLDAAMSGKIANRRAIERIIALEGLKVEVGGGARSAEAVDELLGLGAWRVVVGTVAARHPDEVIEWIKNRPGKICVGIDARDGLVAVEGWARGTSVSDLDLAARFDVTELAALIHTDISRDGMRSGVNIEATRKLAQSVRAPVIASGGVRSMEDILRLAEAPESNIAGVISGRAVYEKSIDLKQALMIRKKS